MAPAFLPQLHVVPKFLAPSFAATASICGRNAGTFKIPSRFVSASAVKNVFLGRRIPRNFRGNDRSRMSAMLSTTQMQQAIPKAREVGTPETFEYRVFLDGDSGAPVSPWHEVPLYVSKDVVNMVNEIPKMTKAKMEVATTEESNPIKQDIKKGQLRYYTYGDMLYNYGCLPQTWEDPNIVQADTGCVGDNDPVDVIDIGEKTLQIGEIAQVKVLGVLGLIDEGECDWKIIAINVSDPKAQLLNDIEDVEQHFPGTVDQIRTWFRDYKVPDGKGQNSYALDGKAMGKAYALEVIAETNKSWLALKQGQVDPNGLSLV